MEIPKTNNYKEIEDWRKWLKNKIEKATVTNAALAGTANALPALPAGYKIEIINGVQYKIPLYKV